MSCATYYSAQFKRRGANFFKRSLFLFRILEINKKWRCIFLCFWSSSSSLLVARIESLDDLEASPPDEMELSDIDDMMVQR
jgi:hypothetical protein